MSTKFLPLVINKDLDDEDISTTIPNEPDKDRNSICQVCFSKDNNNNKLDELYECINCNVLVHCECYGICLIDTIPSPHPSSSPSSSSHYFKCDACKIKKTSSNKSSKSNKISCNLCPCSGGALKKTCNDKLWCHLFCALWIPECGINNIITKKPIIGLNNIPSFRKNINCNICNNLLNKKKSKSKNRKNKNYVVIKCEHYSCNKFIHPMCLIKSGSGSGSDCNYYGKLLINHNNMNADTDNNYLVQTIINKLGKYIWYYLCNKHCKTVNINDLKRIQILKLSQQSWPYWKIHPNPIYLDKKQKQNELINNDNILLKSLPQQYLIHKYQNIIKRMNDNNNNISSSTNIGPIGLLNNRLRDKNNKVFKSNQSLSQSLKWNNIHNKITFNNINISNGSSGGGGGGGAPSVKHTYGHISGSGSGLGSGSGSCSSGSSSASMDVDGDGTGDDGDIKMNDNNDDLHSIPLYEKLRNENIELSRSEVIDLLWNSKEKYFEPISCLDYLRISPYDYRLDTCFSKPLFGKSFFNKNTLNTVKSLTSIHHYNLNDQDDDENEEEYYLNKTMGLPDTVNNQNDIALVNYRLGLNINQKHKLKLNFDNINGNGNNNSNNSTKWDGRYSTYKTENDPIGWRWVLNRWNKPKHIKSVSCICIQCRETVDLYNRKYHQAVNDYNKIKNIIPKYRQTDDKQYIASLNSDDTDIDIDMNNNNNNNDNNDDDDNDAINDPQILQFNVNDNDKLFNKIPVIIQSKHGKVLTHFKYDGNANNINNNNHVSLPYDLGPNPPPIYHKFNEIMDSKNKPTKKTSMSSLYDLTPTLSVSDNTSISALNALYSSNDNDNDNNNNNSINRKRKYSDISTDDNDNDNRPAKRIKLDLHNNIKLDSFRQLSSENIILEDDDKDSLAKYLSDKVFELYEKLRSNDSIRHMIRTNLANKVKTESMIEYEKLHEIVVAHFIRHSCIWLRIRLSLARGYSDESGTFCMSQNNVNNLNNKSDEDEDYSVCTVCFDGSFSDDNPIVFCDICNVGIHRYCYGITKVPNEYDKWNCDSCQYMVDNHNNINQPQCCLCPIRGCALKQTSSGGFAHVACALWINGVNIGDIITMNPINNILNIEKKQNKLMIKKHLELLKIGLYLNNNNAMMIDDDILSNIGVWNHKCIVCNDDNGLFIKCFNKKCLKRFHVLCCWFGGYHMNINIDNDNGNIITSAYCLQHTPGKYDGNQRKLEYYKKIRGNGAADRKYYRNINKKKEKYSNLIDKLIVLPDKYLNNKCSICFNNYINLDNYILLTCIKCNITVHKGCYNGIYNNNNNNNNIDWKCDLCIKYPYYHQTLFVNTDDDDADDINKDIFNDSYISCLLCPRRGGAFKEITITNNNNNDANNKTLWIHAACASWSTQIKYNQNIQKLVINQNYIDQLIKMTNDNQNECYLCHRHNNTINNLIKCEYNDCCNSFHTICGLFGDCYLKAHQLINNKNKFKFKFYCNIHKYKTNTNNNNNNNNNSISIKFNRLGQHLLYIQRLRLKLKKIDIISTRINEYELSQRGIIDNTTMEYKQFCRKNKHKKFKKNKKNKDKKSKKIKKKRSNNYSISGAVSDFSKYKFKDDINNDDGDDGDDVDDINDEDYNIEEDKKELIKKRRNNSNKYKKQKINQNNLNIKTKIKLITPTDFYADQSGYSGGEIKLVEKRNGISVYIPRLKLPKSCKYRYSKKERKEMEKLKKKNKNNNNNNNNNAMETLLAAIKDKEVELGINNNNNNNNKDNNDKILDRFSKYRSGGKNWYITTELKQPKTTSPKLNPKICPYCKKEKAKLLSLTNWIKHLNAKHIFKCKLCNNFFTRHNILMLHLKQCNK